MAAGSFCASVIVVKSQSDLDYSNQTRGRSSPYFLIFYGPDNGVN